jgi:hypothetical protein
MQRGRRGGKGVSSRAKALVYQPRVTVFTIIYFFNSVIEKICPWESGMIRLVVTRDELDGENCKAKVSIWRGKQKNAAS